MNQSRNKDLFSCYVIINIRQTQVNVLYSFEWYTNNYWLVFQMVVKTSLQIEAAESVREAFSYGIRHISLWFNKAQIHTSLNHNEICCIPYENASCTGVRNRLIFLISCFRVSNDLRFGWIIKVPVSKNTGKSALGDHRSCRVHNSGVTF